MNKRAEVVKGFLELVKTIEPGTVIRSQDLLPTLIELTGLDKKVCSSYFSSIIRRSGLFYTIETGVFERNFTDINKAKLPNSNHGYKRKKVIILEIINDIFEQGEMDRSEFNYPQLKEAVATRIKNDGVLDPVGIYPLILQVVLEEGYVRIARNTYSYKGK